MTTKLVTIGVPVYKRLQNLSRILEVVAAQDYPHVELLVSDNGMNGNAVHEIVRSNPMGGLAVRVRQNLSSVSQSTHFNQLIEEADGEYFVLLADDDELTANYVSELVTLIERHPDASLAMGVQETIDDVGDVMRSSSRILPETLSGVEFVRAAWQTGELQYESFSTFLARTAALRTCGGFPDFHRGRGIDDALVLKLCLGHGVALTNRCSFRKRYDDASYGLSLGTGELARGLTDFIQFLDTDRTLQGYAESRPEAWRKVKAIMTSMIWRTYYGTWVAGYHTTSAAEWLRQGFALPYNPAYYAAVVLAIARLPLSAAWRRLVISPSS